MRIIGTNRETGKRVIAELRKKQKIKVKPKGSPYKPTNPNYVA